MNKNIINEEAFVEIMNDVQKAYDYEEGLNNFLKKHDVDGYIYQPDCVGTTLRLLHLMFEDKDIDEWISYFCFELDFGRKYKDGIITDKDGKNIPLATTKDLYALLTN